MAMGMTPELEQVAVKRAQERWMVAFAVAGLLIVSAVLAAFLPMAGIAIPGVLALWAVWTAWRAGRASRIAAASVLCVSLLAFGILSFYSARENTRVAAQRAQLEAKLRDSLRVGDSSEKIERVLRQNGLQVAYSEELHAYNASRATGVNGRRLDVSVRVDAENRMLGVDVKVFNISW
jgi:uncharacterized membrane protein YqjE